MRKLMLAGLAVMLGIMCVVYHPSDASPPGWNETHLVFSSDEDMCAYDEYLVFDTEGLTVSDAYRCLTFDSPQHVDGREWSCLEVSYRMADDDSTVSMFVYPEVLEETDGFPFRHLDVHQMNSDGVSVLYQKLEDQTNSFRALFVYNGYTYEVTVYSPTNSDVLIDYLHRITASAK